MGTENVTTTNQPAVPASLHMLRAEYQRIGTAIQALEGCNSENWAETPHTPPTPHIAGGTPAVRRRGRPAGSVGKTGGNKTMAKAAGA